MSHYQSWSIAPTKGRPHPGILGEASFLDSIDWVAIANASLKELPGIVSNATSKATSQAATQGASSSELAALQMQIAAIAADRQRLRSESDKQAKRDAAQASQRRKDIKTRNLLILGGIGVVGLLGAVLILK